MPWFLIISIITALITVVSYMTSRRRVNLRDPYGSFHVELNRDTRHSDADGSIPRTEWLNMGFWKDTESFPVACEALALQLIQAAECRPGGHVLDVGHGSGDSLLLQLQHPMVPRPARLTGITSLKAHHQSSYERVRVCQSRWRDAQDVNVKLYLGDAVYRASPPDSAANEHPLGPNGCGCAYTSILALDCAYHFRTRESFLAQSFAHLAPGGQIALADICFADHKAPAPALRKFIGMLGVMAAENIVTQKEYVHRMEEIGFTDVHLTDISPHVFPGFMRFLKSRGLLWQAFVAVFEMFVNRGATFVIITGRRPHLPC